MITYNHEKYIGEAIEGVLMQECDFEVELIIADDASQDQTGEIVRTYIENHPKGSWIKYYRHSENKGMMSNFVWALEQCKGKYIALCEGDDYWTESNKLQRQVEFLNDNKSFSSVFHDSNLVDENNKLINSTFLPSSSKMNLTIKDIIKGKIIPTASILFRKSSIPLKFPIILNSANNGDFILFFYLTKSGTSFYLKDSIYSSYRLHSGGVWSTLNNEQRLTSALGTFSLVVGVSDIKTKIRLFNRMASMCYELYKVSLRKSYLIYIFQYSILGFNIRVLLFTIYKVGYNFFLRF